VNYDIFTQNVRKECKKQKTSVHAMLESCGIRKGLLYDIEKRGTDISFSTAVTIANQLDCSLDYLLDRHYPVIKLSSLNEIDQDYIKERRKHGKNTSFAELAQNRNNDNGDTLIDEFMKHFQQLNFENKIEIMGECLRLLETQKNKTP
jgi:transcriptional regulator with XRE-family HTH domain